MASLNSMRNNLNYWNRQKREAEKEIRDLKKRRNDVKAVQTTFFSVVNKNADDINRKIRSVGQKMGDAVLYGKGNRRDYVLTGNVEETVGVDKYVTQVERELQKELNAIESQINEEESTLFRAKDRISDLKRDIYAEERRLKEEGT